MIYREWYAMYQQRAIPSCDACPYRNAAKENKRLGELPRALFFEDAAEHEDGIIIVGMNPGEYRNRFSYPISLNVRAMLISSERKFSSLSRSLGGFTHIMLGSDALRDC